MSLCREAPTTVTQQAPAAQVRWDMDSLSTAPRVFGRLCLDAGVISEIVYEGLPWRNRPTRVFSFCGMPAADVPRPVPAMVLVHGGRGTARRDWVRQWVARGYAAISMDCCGCFGGTRSADEVPRTEYSGPDGWGRFDLAHEPVADQWPYHAVADVILAHSLLRSFPDVDPARIGLTGISWGGVLSGITAAVDRRFGFVAPVYGCGFLGDGSCLTRNAIAEHGEDRVRTWLSLWDPSLYLRRARAPMLWASGTNDIHFPMDILQRSYRLPSRKPTLCIRPEYAHGHEPAMAIAEVPALADALFRDGPPLPSIDRTSLRSTRAGVAFSSTVPVVRAELVYTFDAADWPERRWQSLPARVDAARQQATAELPQSATAWFFNLIDQQGRLVSSQHEG